MNEQLTPRRLGWVGPALLLMIATVAAVVMLHSDDQPPDPIAITAVGPRFESLDALFDAADIVVEGTIITADDGRTITDPTQPDAGLITALFQLDVATVFKGTDATQFTIEQEATLLDGTPIVVNELPPNQIGDTGYWFLVRGPTNDFPYVALVNEQARILTTDPPALNTAGLTQLNDDLLKLEKGE